MQCAHLVQTDRVGSFSSYSHLQNTAERMQARAPATSAIRPQNPTPWKTVGTVQAKALAVSTAYHAGARGSELQTLHKAATDS